MNQINKIKKIDLSFYQFGPVLAKYKLNEEFITTLLTKGTKSKIDISSKLAGHIDNEKEFSKQECNDLGSSSSNKWAEMLESKSDSKVSSMADSEPPN